MIDLGLLFQWRSVRLRTPFRFPNFLAEGPQKNQVGRMARLAQPTSSLQIALSGPGGQRITQSLTRKMYDR
jgi:hypothetical protein